MLLQCIEFFLVHFTDEESQVQPCQVTLGLALLCFVRIPKRCIEELHRQCALRLERYFGKVL